MLRTVIFLFAFSLITTAFAQVAEDNCYLKWMKKFEERGGEHVADGTYDDVIITFRQGTAAQCYNGKVIVHDGKIHTYYLLMEDGNYEEVKKKLKYEMDIPINSGVSKTIVTQYDELINIMFVKKLKPKKKGYVKAAEPVDD